MKTSAWAWLAAALLLAGNALAQPPVGSAGEAAPPIAGLAPGTGSFQNQPVTQKVDVTDAMMLESDRSDDWILHGRTYDNQRFSPLTQINAGNVKQLRPIAILQTGITKTFENTPIEVDGVLYLETADNQVQAWDAVTGKRAVVLHSAAGLFQSVLRPAVAAASPSPTARSSPPSWTAMSWRWTRAPASWSGRPTTPMPCPQPAYFYSFTMAPHVYNGLVLVGNAGAEWPTRGFLEALDAKTGKLVWRFYTTAAPDRARRQDLGRRQLEIWRRLGVEHAGDRSEERPDHVRHRQSQSRPGWRQPQGRQRLYRLHRRHPLQRPARSPGGTSRWRTTSGTMTPAPRWCCSTPWTSTARSCRRRRKPARSASSSSSTA